MARKDPKLLTVLHVEDDENDAVLLCKACERARLPVRLMRVADGEDARAYLLGEGKYSDLFVWPRPQVVVLDLKLPGMNGFDFLKWMRSREEFTSIPVLVFTSSLSRDDKARALGDGASSYFIKPTSFDALVRFVECLRMTDEQPFN